MKPKNNSHHDLPKKVFDVSRPGKTLAETTSRSVIVGHKPQVQDPMMMHPDEQRSLLDAKHKVTVTPSAPVVPEAEQLPVTDLNPEAVLAAAEPTITDAPEPTASAANEVSVPAVPAVLVPEEQQEVVPSTQTPTPKAEAVEPVKVATDTPTAPTGLQESPSTGPIHASNPEPEDSVAAIFSEGRQEAETSTTSITSTISQEPLPDISDAHVYPPTTMIVSHHDKSARMGKILLWLLVALLLAAVAADILLDAGFFVLDVPHTDFF